MENRQRTIKSNYLRIVMKIIEIKIVRGPLTVVRF
jgi:hypothetical protein